MPHVDNCLGYLLPNQSARGYRQLTPPFWGSASHQANDISQPIGLVVNSIIPRMFECTRLCKTELQKQLCIPPGSAKFEAFQRTNFSLTGASIQPGIYYLKDAL